MPDQSIPCPMFLEDSFNGFVLISPPTPGATQRLVGVYFTARYRALVSSRMRLLDHTQRRATVDSNPLKE